MRTYLYIFFNLLMPISAVIALATVVYFSLSYDLSKALKLGILYGVMIGLPVSLIASLMFMTIRKRKLSVQEGSDTLPTNTDVEIEASSSNSRAPIEQKLMLLMDKKLAFDVARFSITDQNLGKTKTKESKEKCTISLQTQHETIQIISTSLTRHTSQLVLKAAKNSQELQKIITYIKQKEHSFLQY